jgi:hypothetical protein
MLWRRKREILSSPHLSLSLSRFVLPSLSLSLFFLSLPVLRHGRRGRWSGISFRPLVNCERGERIYCTPSTKTAGFHRYAGSTLIEVHVDLMDTNSEMKQICMNQILRKSIMRRYFEAHSRMQFGLIWITGYIFVCVHFRPVVIFRYRVIQNFQDTYFLKYL